MNLSQRDLLTYNLLWNSRYHPLETRQPLTSWTNTCVWMDAYDLVTCRCTCTRFEYCREKKISKKTCAPSHEHPPAFCARSQRLWSGLICSDMVLCHNGSGGSRPVKHTIYKRPVIIYVGVRDSSMKDTVAFTALIEGLTRRLSGAHTANKNTVR